MYEIQETFQLFQGAYKIESNTKTEYGGFKRHQTHSKMDILKKFVKLKFYKVVIL
jgi:hypothetical protein